MNQNSSWKFSDDGDLNGYTLIIPSVAVGNVGQLACDLLISSLQMKKIASVYSPALIPVVAYDPYDLSSNRFSCSCEVYKCTSRKIAVLQLRAPLVYKYARAFLEDLLKTFKEKNVKEIIVLTSSFAHEKKHIQTSPFRYVASDNSSYKKTIKTLNWLEHDFVDDRVKIYGGGFASLLYDISQEFKLPCLIVYKYCSEGDNIPDAYDMIDYLKDVLPMFKDNLDILSQLVQPVSWKLLFGRPPPSDIY